MELLLRCLTHILLESDALRRLLLAQQLDSHDVVGAFRVYCELEGLGRAHVLAEEADRQAAEQSVCSALDALRSLERPHALALLRDFLTAQAAKDCAIMVALQHIPSDVSAGEGCFSWQDAVTPTCLRYRLAFVDLDLKSVARMPAYRALDAACCSEGGGNVRICSPS